jgi:hypothetical protein
MTAAEFQARYLASLPQNLLDFGLGRFIPVPPEEFAESGVAAADVERLTTVGMPKAAAPYLAFGPETWAFEGPLPPSFFVIGTTAAGEPLCIDEETGEVVCYDPGANAHEFVNSSLELFQHCICLFLEHRPHSTWQACFDAMRTLDAGMRSDPGFWMRMIEDEME